MNHFVSVGHPRFTRAHRDIFLKKITPDCMSHRCALVHRGGQVRLDACCRYGADCDVGERDAILEHAPEIRPLLRAEARDRPWFRADVWADPDFPSGTHSRTVGDPEGHGCVFLAQDRRGCAIHAASIEGGWSLSGVKPHVCRLYPLTYAGDALLLSDDYPEYSCALDESAPSVYAVSRPSLEDVFGHALVRALDAAADLVARPGHGPMRPSGDAP